ncbi:hypothetical protein TFKS16_2862 [Tannerella forsythia KS16]|nr:hypothetical protein TFKS16_2862 [Tannerella forsythia KS16]
MRGTRGIRTQRNIPPAAPLQRENAEAQRWGNRRTPLAFVHGPRVVSRRSSEQGDRKSGCPSQASYLIFRPESVAKACEAHEALTFWLLLGQAKSDRKEIQGEERSEGGDVILSKREFAELNADN